MFLPANDKSWNQLSESLVTTFTQRRHQLQVLVTAFNLSD